MTTLGYKDNILISKAEIAITQLNEAISLFINEKYICSLTLASAAEEIFAGILRVKGKTPAIETSHSLIQDFKDVLGLSSELHAKSKKQIFNEWNFVKNKLKHHDTNDALELSFNDFDEAHRMILRALANAKELGVEVSNKQDFQNCVIMRVSL